MPHKTPGMQQSARTTFYQSVLTALFLFLLCGTGLKAQTVSEKAVSDLKAAGFENIRVLQQDNEIVCTIERGLERSPSEDFKQASYLLQKNFPPHTKLRIILLEQGQAVYQLQTTTPETGQITPQNLDGNKQIQDLRVTPVELKYFKTIKGAPVTRPVRSGITLTLYPQLTLQNMYLYRIYEEQFNIAPAISYSGWNGMLITTQLILPIINELNYEGDYIRFGFITFTQSLRLPHLNQLKVTIGNFNNHRYGIDMKWKKQFENSRWSFSANLGYTGYSNNYNRYWNHSSLNSLSWNVKGSYYLASYQLRADLMYGKFIAGDKGFRADLYRHFGEVTIGVYANYTGQKPNGGFHFAIPISPVKRKHAHRLRVMLPSYFDMEYNARNEYVYNRYYETAPDENRSAQDLYPQVIQNHIINP